MGAGSSCCGASVAPHRPTGREPLYRVCYSAACNVKSNDEAARMVSALFALELTSYPRTISGMLFFDRRSKSVLQVLEGPLSTVRRLMDGVIVDDWHLGSVQILDERRIARRLHPDIGMTQALVQDDPNAVKMAQSMRAGPPVGARQDPP